MRPARVTICRLVLESGKTIRAAPRMSNCSKPLFDSNFITLNGPLLTLFQAAMTSRLVTLMIGLYVLGIPIAAQSQVSRIQIKISSNVASEIDVAGEYAQGVDEISFRNSYGGILGLGDRIESFDFVGKDGELTTARKIAPGEFRLSGPAKSFRYSLKLAVPERKADMAHASWLTKDMGILMLSDLLPNLGLADTSHEPLLIDFNLPAGWSAASAIRPDQSGQYRVSQPDAAVFFVGRTVREKVWHIESMELGFVTASQWNFADEEVIKIAGDVIKEYIKLTDFRITGRSILMLAPFPDEVVAGHWSAETRGSTVMLMLGRNGRREDSLARLGIAFTHEFFHLWVPNGVRLAGDYDWFFEGFTLYQALRTALRLGYIDFNEYLNTISRVYDSYLSSPDRDELSLIEASGRRFTGGSSLVYDKAMLLAFIYDLELRAKTGGKLSLDDIYRRLFLTRHDERQDANEVIISLLSAPEGMKQLTKSYIRESGSIELGTVVDPYGLEMQSAGASQHLVIKERLSKEQRKLLRSLGYRN